MTLFISLVTFVLGCKLCSCSNESSTKIIYPAVKGKEGTAMSMLQSYKHVSKHIMANPSPGARKGRNSPLQYVKSWETAQLIGFFIHQYIFTEALVACSVYELHGGTKVLKGWIALFAPTVFSSSFSQTLLPDPQQPLQQSVANRSHLHSLMQSPGD